MQVRTQNLATLLYVFVIPFLTLVPSVTSAAACVPTSSSPHSVTFATPTSGCSYTVPIYDTLTVQAWGGGGGGSTMAVLSLTPVHPLSCVPTYAPYDGYGEWYMDGCSGTASSFGANIIAGGGSGGPNIQAESGWINGGYPTGIGGVAQGGDLDIVGGSTHANERGFFAGYGSAGGDAPYGGVGGNANLLCISGYVDCSNYWGEDWTSENGAAPGGGGGGAILGVGGGSGGYVSKTYSSGEIPPGSIVSVVVGSGGSGEEYSYTGWNSGTWAYWYWNSGGGAPGQVTITWTDPVLPPVSCTISISPNPVAYGSTATLTYSSTGATSFNINNVGPISPNTSGSFSLPSTSADYSGTVVGPGGSNTCAASSGTPAGTLNVTPPSTPTATVTASSTSIHTGQSTNILARFAVGSGDILTHDNIDSPVGTGLGATTNPDAGKTITFTPSSTGTYTFYARAQTSYFTSWTTYASVTITVTAPPVCTPAYTCSSDTIQYTDSSCNVSDVTTCVTPNFCSTGSSVCLTSTPSFNGGSGGLTGHLQAIPSLLPQGLSTNLYWNLSSVSACTVTGSNGDHWTGASSGTSGQISGPLMQQTTYTLSCTGNDNSVINETQVVNVVPMFQER